MSYILYSKLHGVLAKVDGRLEDARLRDGEIAIPCDPDADVNDTELWARKAEEWENRVPTLEEVKASKRAELMSMRDSLVAAGFDWNGHHYPLSPELSGDMLIQLTAMQMLPPPPEYVYQWKDSGGVYRNIGNAEAFKTFCAAALGHGEALFARERMLQELVEAAESIEAVQEISWDTVPEEG